MKERGKERERARKKGTNEEKVMKEGRRGRKKKEVKEKVTETERQKFL